jgi:hypothetical protein
MTLIQGHWSKVKVTIHVMLFYIVGAITFHRDHELEYFTGLYPVRIRVRIGPPHPLVCRKRRQIGDL